MEAKADDKQEKIQQFVEIAGGPALLARQFLEATGWQLDEAIQLYFAGGTDTGGMSVPPSVTVPPTTAAQQIPSPPPSSRPAVPTESFLDSQGGNYVRPPLPVKREVLYEDVFQYRAHRIAHTPNQPTSVDAFRNFEDEANQRALWGAMEASSSSGAGLGGMKDSLAALYRPPFVLMFQGTFEQAKAEAARQAKWLLVNLQSTKEFSSYTLNRDTWAHEAVKETVSMSFVFWQVYDDTEEGRKVCTYYKLITMPNTLVLDPLTGQKMRAWEGMIAPDRLLEDLVPYLDRGPMDKQPLGVPPQKRPRETTPKALDIPTGNAEVERSDDEELRLALAASLEGVNSSVPDAKDPNEQPRATVTEGGDRQGSDEPVLRKRREFPSLPEEPSVGSTASCRVAVRFPDGRRAQRRFMQSDPIQFLWSFSCSHVPEAADGRSFRLTQAIPGATSLDFNSTTTIHEAGLGNSMLAMAWDPSL